MKKTITLLLLLYAVISASAAKYTLSGLAKDKNTGEELIGVNVYIQETKSGTVTNAYGFFSITLDEGTYNVSLSYLGYTNVNQKLQFSSNQRINFELVPDTEEVEEVVITGQRRDKNISSTEMSVENLQIKQIKVLPSFMGETDVIKSLTLMPGVQSGGEGSSGLYVRGGAADQNMILLDEAPVFNSSHLLGFFSVFNADVVKDVKLYKGGIPAQYGGRLSSLIDIRMKDGNSKRLSSSGSFGNVSGKLTLEGPIIPDKMSFIVAGRRTWADVFLLLSSDEQLQDTKLYFYDLNAKLNYTVTDNDRLYLSGYFGRDAFGFGSNFGMTWGNTTLSLRWNHIFTNKLFMNNTFVFSDYMYRLSIDINDDNKFVWNSGIKDFCLKNKFTYTLNPKNQLTFGAEVMHHRFEPGSIEVPEYGNFTNITVPPYIALEGAVFVGNEYKISDRIQVEYGLRVSGFENIGKGKVYEYSDPSDLEGSVIIDSTMYDAWEPIHTEYGLEPRLNVNFRVTDVSSIKLSYNRTYQYLNLVTNTNSPTPLDIYVPSTKYIKPQKADQVAIGYFRNFRENMFETSGEVYYKKMYNQIDYVDNADLLLNPNIEKEMKSGDAYSYGLELMVKKQEGKIGGWVSYTYSHTRRKIPGINDGKEYAPTYDRTHDFSIASDYKLTKRWTLGANWVYSTGIAQTFPNGAFKYGNNVVPKVGERNSHRIESFHRLDVSATFQLLKHNRYEHSLNFSVYNVYSRKNPYSVYFRQNADNPEQTEAVKMSIIGIPVPSVTYSFKF